MSCSAVVDWPCSYGNASGQVERQNPPNRLSAPMAADPLTDAVSERICTHMNRDHAEAVLAYARHFGDRPGASEARMLAVRPEGMELSADGETILVAFDHQLSDSDDAHRTLVAMLRSLPQQS
jgi:putative heme iron utilization protein